jgi:alkaline phosphatase
VVRFVSVMDSDLDESVPLNPPAQHRTRKLAVLGVTLTLVVLAGLMFMTLFVFIKQSLEVLAVVLVAVLTTSQNNVQRGRVLVVMLGDGFGPASVSLLRAFLNHTGVRNRLHLDDHLIGSVQTASLDSRITDSAAGATAYSCGVRNFNNWIATTSDSKACGTLLEGDSFFFFSSSPF